MKAFFKKLKYTPYEIADAIVVDLINMYEQIDFYFKKILGKYSFLKKNKSLKKIHADKRIFLLGNAPSLNDCDLKKLKDKKAKKSCNKMRRQLALVGGSANTQGGQGVK